LFDSITEEFLQNSHLGVHTISEILSEPETWKTCLEELDETQQLQSLNLAISKGTECAFIGCGSSYYVALVAASTWTLLTGEPARAWPASEILLFPQSLPRRCQPVLISRSGHTSEVLEATSFLEDHLHLRTIAVTCGVDTPIEKLATHVICLTAADEKSTVMTRSFTSMLLALQAFASERAGNKEFSNCFHRLASQVSAQLDGIHAKIGSLVQTRSFADYVFLGQGPFYGVAQEATLKVTEMSRSYAQCFHTLEFRHGPKSIVGPDTLVTFFLSEAGFQSEVSVLEEIKNLGGTTLAVTNASNSAVRDSSDCLIELALDVPEIARAAAMIIAGQLLGFHTGVRKGLNPDEPRNLTRVVVLEGDNGGTRRAST
jgi:glucosamine--fructose-6-phosphate aminotransferase (isomerizing)